MEKFLNLRNTFPNRIIFQLSLKVIPMFIRGFFWKLRFKKCSGIVLIGKNVTIYNSQFIEIKKNLVAEDNCEIQGLSKSGIFFGENVTIGRYAMIRPSGYYGREVGIGLKIGDNSNIGPYCYVGCSGGIEIGNDVLMGPRVTIIAENHNFSRVDIEIKKQGVNRQKIIIENDCWLGTGATILAGVKISKGAIVGAGAVVTKDVPPYSIVAGVPAQVVKYRKEDKYHSDM
jgi:acetyltransferase-like isoleucine patch superfamily enzyme